MAAPLIVGGLLFAWVAWPSREERELEKSVGKLDREIEAALKRKAALKRG